MAAEITFSGISSARYYVHLRNSAGLVWSTAALAFVAFVKANWAQYVIAATEQDGSGVFLADLPSAVDAGRFVATPYLRGGASASSSDLPDVSIVVYDAITQANITTYFANGGIETDRAVDDGPTSDELRANGSVMAVDLGAEYPEFTIGAKRVPLTVAQTAKTPLTFIVKRRGAAVDLDEKDLRFIVYSGSTASFTVENGEALAVGGAGANQVAVNVNAADVPAAGVFAWELWNLTDDELLGAGPFTVVATKKNA